MLSLATGLALIWMMAVVMLRPFSKELSDIVVVVNYVGFFFFWHLKIIYAQSSTTLDVTLCYNILLHFRVVILL